MTDTRTSYRADLPARLCLMACLFAHVGHSKPNERVFRLSTPKGDSPASNCVVLTNKGARDAVFCLKWNDDGFYATSADLAKAISRLPPESPDEPLHRKVWRFVISRSYHPHPAGYLTELGWQECPPLFINSLGFGYCDDSATVCYYLWKRMGYTCRVVKLGGHVVPEVEVNGRWEMYDPSFKTYYHDTQGNVAGVAQLASSPQLITKPIRPVTNKGNRCYSAWMAARYSSRSDNGIAKHHMVKELPYELAFTLPAYGSLVLPLPPVKDLKVAENRSSPKKVANAALHIPPGWRGKLDIALVVQEIDGSIKDSVRIKQKTFAVGSDKLQQFIDRRTYRAPGWDGLYFSRLDFSPLAHPVVVRYLVNPLLIQMKRENVIRITGKNLDKVEAGLRSREMKSKSGARRKGD